MPALLDIQEVSTALNLPIAAVHAYVDQAKLRAFPLRVNNQVTLFFRREDVEEFSRQSAAPKSRQITLP